MKWLDRWRKQKPQATTLAAPEIERVNPAASIEVVLIPGMAEQHDFDQVAHNQVYKKNVYAFAAMRAIARDVASTPLQVEQRRIIDGTAQWEVVTKHPLVDLLEYPNPDETIEQVIERMVLQLQGTGNGYFAADDQDNEIYCIQSEWVSVTYDARGRVRSYELTNQGRELSLDALSIIHFKLANPTGVVYGMPPGEAIKSEILTKLAFNAHVKSYFKNNAMLGTILSTGGTLTPDQRAIMRKEFERIHRGAENAFKVGIMEGGVTATQLATSLKDSVPTELDDILMRVTLAAYGATPIVIGDQDQKYANAVEQMRKYQQGTIEPIRRHIEGNFTLQYVRPRYGAEIRVRFNRNDIQALQEDQTAKSTRKTAEYRAGIITLNEARTSLGYDPVDPIDGGDEFYHPPTPSFSFGSDNSQGSESENAPPRIHTANRRREAITDKAAQRDFDSASHVERVISFEASLATVIEGYFRAQKRRVLEAIDGLTARGKFPSRLWNRLPIRLSDEEADSLSDIFDHAVENELLREAAGPQLKKIAQKAGQAAANHYGLAVKFNVDNPHVMDALRAVENRITKINSTTYEYIKAIIRNAYEDGETVASVATRIEALFDGFTRERAETVARTETNGIVNAGAEESYRQSGVVERKGWLATQDPVTRDAHSEADGQIVGLNDSFLVDGEYLRYPGDPAGSAGNVINCRCAVEPVLD